MALLVDIKRFKTIKVKYAKFVRCEFRGIIKSSNIYKHTDEYLNVNERFVWELGNRPLNPGETLLVQLIAHTRWKDKSMGVFRLGMQVLTVERVMQVVDALVSDDTNQATPVFIEMTIYYDPYYISTAATQRMAGFPATSYASVPPLHIPRKNYLTEVDLGAQRRAAVQPQPPELLEAVRKALIEKYGNTEEKGRERKDSRKELSQPPRESAQSSVHESTCEEYDLLMQVQRNIDTIEKSLKERETAIEIESDDNDSSRDDKLKKNRKPILQKRHWSFGEAAAERSQKFGSPTKKSSAFSAVKNLMHIGRSKQRNTHEDEEVGLLDVAAGTSATEATSSTSASSDEAMLVDFRRMSLPDTKKLRSYAQLDVPTAQKSSNFQICVKIIEARQLAGLNMDPLVAVRVGDQTKLTSVKESTNCPYFNEYFVFDFTLPPVMLMDKIITLSVLQSRNIFRPNKLLGSFKLDVATVWKQPDRQFYHKWAPLTDPKDIAAGSKGYLLCDISVIGKGGKIKVPPKLEEYDDIEANLLLPTGIAFERQRARFIVSVHKADGLPDMNYSVVANVKKALTGERKDLVDPYVEVSFAGMTGQTRVIKNTYTPEWNEEIVFTEMFPPLCQRIKIQIRDHDALNHASINIIATHFIDLRSISHDGELGFIPTFGPSYLHLYGSTRTFSMVDKLSHLNNGMDEGISYRGRILISIRTEIMANIEYLQKNDVKMDTLLPISDTDLAKNDDFYLFASIFEANMIDPRFVDKSLSFEISIGKSGDCSDDHSEPINNINDYLATDMDELKVDTGFWQSTTYPCKPTTDDRANLCLPYLDTKQCMHVRSIWPDLRRRMYNSNRIANIIEQMEVGLSEAEEAQKKGDIDASVVQLKHTLEVCIHGCNSYVRHMNKSAPLGNTKLDREWLKMCLKELSKTELHMQKLRACVTRSSVKERLTTANDHLDNLKLLCNDVLQSMPDVFIWLISNEKRQACHRVPAREIIFSEVPDETGKFCGKMQNIFLKRFQMRAYIYQARSLIGSDASGLSDPFARVFISNLSRTTQVIDQTLSPTWDETLVFENIILYSTVENIKTDPPTVVVEIFDQDSVGKSEFIGRTLVKPIIKSLEDVKNNPQCLPALEWHNVRRGDDMAGELLAAFELLEMDGLEAFEVPALPSPTKLLTSNLSFDLVNKGPILPVPRGIRPTLSKYRIEVLFWGLRDLKRVHYLTVDKPRADIECSGHTLTSTVIQNAKHNPNFSNPTKFIELELPDQDVYQPPLTIRVVDCRSFGRNVLVGTHTINSIQKYIFTPMSKRERNIEERKKSLIQLQNVDLRAKCILQEDVFTVRHEREDMPLLPRSMPANYSLSMRGRGAGNVRRAAERTRGSRRRRKFSSGSIHDEEEADSQDWWTRYYASNGVIIDDMKEKNTKGRMSSLQPQPSTSGVVTSQPRDEARVPLSPKEKSQLSTSSVAVPPKITVVPKTALIQVYPHELEAVPEFEEFIDWLHTFDLYRGKKTEDDSDDESRIVGSFKGAIKVYKWPLSREMDEYTITGHNLNLGFFQGVPSNEPIHVLVRIYIVKATDLHPMDINGKADPYIVLNLGNKKIVDKESYVSKQLNPVFGNCYEIEATFPQDSKLKITVYDWDLVGLDDIIGETKIDLENRFYSRHRATCGLPIKYEESGINRWRDSLKPTQILAKLCKDGKLEPPVYQETRVKIGKTVFNMPLEDTKLFSNPETFEEQKALVVLRRWKEVPRVGCHLVTEHVETRSLYNPKKPGIEQGRLQMWVDMFPMDMPPPPPPVDISPRKPKSYEMRVIIWNTDDVVLEDDAFFTGEKMSDIYVKGWVKGPDDCQSTDIHYRSLTGEGNFNWRFIYTFEYLEAEERIVTSRKESVFSWDETECKIPARLELQVWDSDHFSADDFLGALTLDLNRFPRGAKSAKQCTLQMMSNDGTIPTVNIFKQKRIRGWWPFYIKRDTEEMELTGKVEAEIQLLTRDEADRMPAGLGRNEPEALEKPNRPDASFMWFLNPLKSIRYILWHNYKYNILRYGVFGLMFLLMFLLLIAFPGYLVKKLLGA